MHVQLCTPGEFVKIAKDARKRPFAAHLKFSDSSDNFTPQILLWVFFFFTWEVLNCSFINVIMWEWGRNREEKNVEKRIFPIVLKQ